MTHDGGGEDLPGSVSNGGVGVLPVWVLILNLKNIISVNAKYVLWHGKKGGLIFSKLI